MKLSPNAYALLGLTGMVGALIAALTFALLRFVGAARDARRQVRGNAGDTALLTAALQEAVTKLKAQERATAARAEASERLSGEIITSLTAGLLVVGLEGQIRIINPAGRRMLGLAESASIDQIRSLLRELTLGQVIDECLATSAAIVRRTVELPSLPHRQG